jgi:hypothetical protein
MEPASREPAGARFQVAIDVLDGNNLVVRQEPELADDDYDAARALPRPRIGRGARRYMVWVRGIRQMARLRVATAA